MNFDWDDEKAAKNLKKHKVSFTEGSTVFFNIYFEREDGKAEGEQIFVAIGPSDSANLLVVAYTYREPDIIWIISARKAEPAERTAYGKKIKA